ncbi:MAG TPA: Rieske (2Fe-2S) protein [Stellaceae bacterium]|jgi:nitrite reductase/ring-hydroxylating ferredoxin subunit|nr:Rieske (2Fe-2S) protein [Stellaceae bacterium]
MDSAALPADWYTDPDAFAQERRTLFAREWQMAGRVDQLVAPGAYICANLAGWPVFALRDETGTLGAFRNACRHQNLPVLDNGAGTAKLLRCRYHGWTYDFTGAFVTAPPMVAPPDPAAPDHHLQRFGVAEWRGLVFINPDATAESPAASLDALKIAPLDRWNFHGELAADINCNWKALVELYLSNPFNPFPFSFAPPLAVVPAGFGVVVNQIVPRTHLRSRVVNHLYFPAGGAPEAVADMVERNQQMAARTKAGAEALQAGFQAGILPPEMPVPNPRLAGFRERMRAVHAETPG